MGTILASAIITKGRQELFDTDSERWSDATLLGLLNEGQRALVIYKKNAYITNGTVTMAAGTKQSLPAGATILIDVPRNTNGRVVREADRSVLDAKAPNWHLADAEAEVRHWMYSIADPMHWYCYPPNNGSGSVEMIHGAIPPDIATVGTAITVGDEYEIPLLDYMLYRAFSIDSEFAADQSRADKHLTAFIAALTGKAKGEVGATPASAG